MGRFHDMLGDSTANGKSYLKWCDRQEEVDEAMDVLVSAIKDNPSVYLRFKRELKNGHR